MIDRLLWASASLAAVVNVVQPGVPRPPAAPLRELLWGDLNFLHTTDTHGWHGGHLQESSYSADWGDYVSFAEHMRNRADEIGADLLLVDTGDRIEGNGLYDASFPKGKYTVDIFKEQDIDVLCSGNHELYQKVSADNEYLHTVPNFHGNYLSSNIDIIDPDSGKRVPLAPRFRKFTTKNRAIRIMSFGFLFDFTGNYNNTIVQPVEDTIKEEWFQDAIRDKDIDLFLVIGHVAIRSKEYDAIHKAIRNVHWDTPIQYFGGHTHIRDYKKYDSKAYALESGRYLETIGFMSIDGIGKAKDESQASAKSLKFKRRYIDNNLFSFHHHTGLNDTTFPTEHGLNVTNSITKARRSLHLDEKLGCTPRDLWLNRAKYPGSGSIFSWLEDDVLPETIVNEQRQEKPRLVLMNTGAIRFDLFKGPFTRDNVYSISPFASGFRYIKDVPYKAASKLLRVLNSEGPIFEQYPELLRSIALASPEQLSVKEDIVRAQEENVGLRGQRILGQPDLQAYPPGYTTKDDDGEYGDDTVHSPISFYRVPNCIQAEVGVSHEEDTTPDVVDVVYMDFIQPWIILALNFLGQEYKIDDTEIYMKGKSMSDVIIHWVKEHWTGDC